MATAIHRDWPAHDPLGVGHTDFSRRVQAEGQAYRFVWELCDTSCFTARPEEGYDKEFARAAFVLVGDISKAAVRKGWGKRKLTDLRDKLTGGRPLLSPAELREMGKLVVTMSGRERHSALRTPAVTGGDKKATVQAQSTRPAKKSVGGA